MPEQFHQSLDIEDKVVSFFNPKNGLIYSFTEDFPDLSEKNSRLQNNEELFSLALGEGIYPPGNSITTISADSYHRIIGKALWENPRLSYGYVKRLAGALTAADCADQSGPVDTDFLSTPSKLSRREFLKITAGSLAAISLLAACVPVMPENKSLLIRRVRLGWE